MGPEGFEPSTPRLKGECSTPELRTLAGLSPEEEKSSSFDPFLGNSCGVESPCFWDIYDRMQLFDLIMADKFFYNTAHHPKGPQSLPTFVLRDGLVYTTPHHSDGEDPRAWYVVRDDRVYPTEHHPQRAALAVPWYEIRGGAVYAAEGHPHGRQLVAWFNLQD